MLYKQIDKWREVFRGDILTDLSARDGDFWSAPDYTYSKNFKNAVSNLVYSVEEYYLIFEDGDEFKTTKSGIPLDQAVDAHVDELRELISRFKQNLMEGT